MNGITSVPGIRVGHAEDPEARTGCTVVVGPFRGACDARGLATGTRELNTLSPLHLVDRADAVLLTGGSAFGLAAADGVVDWLAEHGGGYETGVTPVPIVPAAVIFDLGMGRSDRRPDAIMGRRACEAATAGAVREGAVGAGTGATVGKLRGTEHASAGGVGTWAMEGPACTIGALAVVNAFGDVRAADGRVLAGARDDAGEFLDMRRALVEGAAVDAFERPSGGPGVGANTTLAVVATDAPLSRTALGVVARAAATGVARRISPVHTPFDGDVTFALSTAPDASETDPALLLTLGAIAGATLERAIERAVTEHD